MDVGFPFVIGIKSTFREPLYHLVGIAPKLIVLRDKLHRELLKRAPGFIVWHDPYTDTHAVTDLISGLVNPPVSDIVVFERSKHPIFLKQEKLIHSSLPGSWKVVVCVGNNSESLEVLESQMRLDRPWKLTLSSGCVVGIYRLDFEGAGVQPGAVYVLVIVNEDIMGVNQVSNGMEVTLTLHQ